MWKQIETSRNNILLYLNYEDFATIEVEKKTNNKGVTFYEINFHIEDVTDQSVVCYKLEDVKVVLERAKDEIEEFYLDKDDYSDEEIYSWLDDFVELINEF